ncbi:MAG: ankyrin repeat domain-containing protein [Bacteriovoracaceae bacterium]
MASNEVFKKFGSAIDNAEYERLYQLSLDHKGVDVKSEKIEQTPLLYACALGDKKAFDELLALGADAYYEDNKGLDCLSYAALNNEEQFVLDVFTPYYLLPKKSSMPIASAILVGNTNLVKFFLKRRFPLNTPTKEGFYPLSLALSKKPIDHKLIRLLLKNGADPSVINLSRLKPKEKSDIQIVNEMKAAVKDEYYRNIRQLLRNIDIVSEKQINGIERIILKTYDQEKYKRLNPLQKFNLQYETHRLMLCRNKIIKKECDSLKDYYRAVLERNKVNFFFQEIKARQKKGERLLQTFNSEFEKVMALSMFKKNKLSHNIGILKECVQGTKLKYSSHQFKGMAKPDSDVLRFLTTPKSCSRASKESLYALKKDKNSSLLDIVFFRGADASVILLQDGVDFPVFE